jgi:hypothetical protein
MMSVQLLNQLISGTDRSRGGLRVRLDPKALEKACAVQGLSFASLGRIAHLSPPTITLAARGDPITPRSALKIADALSRRLQESVLSQ